MPCSTTFATWAIESGAREIDVQMLLGHSDLTMTQRYARTYTSEQAVRSRRVRADDQRRVAPLALNVALELLQPLFAHDVGIGRVGVELFERHPDQTRGVSGWR